MMDFMGTFAKQLREKQQLRIRLASLDSDPHVGCALIGSFKVHPPSAGAELGPELSIVKLYHDPCKGRLFVEISCADKAAMDLIHPAISPAISAVIAPLDAKSLTLPIIICREESYLDTSDPKLKGEFWQNPYIS